MVAAASVGGRKTRNVGIARGCKAYRSIVVGPVEGGACHCTAKGNCSSGCTVAKDLICWICHRRGWLHRDRKGLRRTRTAVGSRCYRYRRYLIGSPRVRCRKARYIGIARGSKAYGSIVVGPVESGTSNCSTKVYRSSSCTVAKDLIRRLRHCRCRLHGDRKGLRRTRTAIRRRRHRHRCYLVGSTRVRGRKAGNVGIARGCKADRSIIIGPIKSRTCYRAAKGHRSSSRAVAKDLICGLRYCRRRLHCNREGLCRTWATVRCRRHSDGSHLIGGT